MDKFEDRLKDSVLNEEGLEYICKKLVSRAEDLEFALMNERDEFIRQKLLSVVEGIQSNPLDYFKTMSKEFKRLNLTDGLVAGVLATFSLLDSLEDVICTLEWGENYLVEEYFYSVKSFSLYELLETLFRIYKWDDISSYQFKLLDLYSEDYFDYRKRVFKEYYLRDDKNEYDNLVSFFLKGTNYCDLLLDVEDSIKRGIPIEYMGLLKSSLEFILFKVYENIIEMGYFKPLLDLDQKYAMLIYNIINGVAERLMDPVNGFDKADQHIIELYAHIDLSTGCKERYYNAKEHFMGDLCISIGVDLANCLLLAVGGKSVFDL